MCILNGLSYSDADFFLQQRELGRSWAKPVILAITLHVVSFALTVTLPHILDREPILDEVVTVNLVSLPDIQEPAPRQSEPPPSAPEKKPVEVKEIEPAKAKVQITDVPEAPPVKVESVKPVSLKPIKRKEKKSDPEKIAQEKERLRRERERQQNLADLARARQQEEEARRAAEEARAELAAMLRQKETRQAGSESRRSSGGKEIKSIVVRNYLAALHSQVQRYWVLPDMKKWDARLETVVALYINRNGTVKTVIEKKSKDPFYDQFVMKTLDSALPLPPLPKMITEDPLEVVLIFKPGELLSM